MESLRQSAITPRVRSFDFSGSALEVWYRGDLVASHFYNAFFIIIPAYERLVVTVMSKSAPGLGQAELRQAVRLFCRQESAHSKEHVRYNKALERRGYPWVRRIDEIHQGIVDSMLRDMPLRVLQSITAFGEHMTAAMCDDYLKHRSLSRATSDEVIDDFWSWHSLEEVEHKAMCFDVFAAAGVSPRQSYWLRMLGLLIGLPLFQVTILGNHLYLLFKARRLFKLRTAASLRKIWGRHLARLLGDVRDYMSPSFRP